MSDPILFSYALSGVNAGKAPFGDAISLELQADALALVSLDLTDPAMDNRLQKKPIDALAEQLNRSACALDVVAAVMAATFGRLQW